MSTQLNPTDERLDMLQTAIARLAGDAESIAEEMSEQRVDSSNLEEITKQQLRSAEQLAAICYEQGGLVNEYCLTLKKAITATNHQIEAAERAIAEAQNNLPIIYDLIRGFRLRRN